MEGKSASPDTGDVDARLPEGSGRRPGHTHWLGSSVWQRALLERNFTAALSGIALIVAVVIWSSSGLRKGASGLGVGATVIFLTSLSVAYIRFTLARIRYEERGEAASNEAVDKAIGELSSTPSLVELMALNQLQMNRYHDIARHQAQNAYRNCQIAMAVGLLIIVMDAVAVIVLKDSTSKFVLIGVGIVGASFAVYITRTFLSVRESAAEQFQRASNQPLIGSYYLWIERIASALPEEHRDQQFVKIIDTLLLQAREYAGHTIAFSSRRRGLPGRLTSIQAEPATVAAGEPWLGEDPIGMSRVWLPWQNRQAVQGPAQELDGPSDTDTNNSVNE